MRMNKKGMPIFITILVILIVLSLLSLEDPAAGENMDALTLNPYPTVETAVFAGGCFWGVEGVFERLKGVKDVVSGYSGGSAATAHYYIVGTGTTGHAESVFIEFDPAIITYSRLLEVFFSVAHDPTQLNYQGPDAGTQYRSAVFYTSEIQKQLASEYIAKLDRSGIFPGKIVTQVVPLEAFYPAEDYHQNFMALNPDYPYILYWDAPKIRHLEQKFPELLADD